MKLPTVIVTAYSKAPQNTSMYENNKVYGLILEIDRASHLIINAETTVMTDIVKNYLKKILVGVNFKEDISPIIEIIKLNYHAPSQNAMIVALKVAHQRYHDNCLSD